jgi:hypothetical protein
MMWWNSLTVMHDKLDELGKASDLVLEDRGDRIGTGAKPSVVI